MGKNAYSKPAVVTYTAQDMAEILGPAQGLSSGVAGTHPSLDRGIVGRRGNGTFGH